MIAFVTSLRSRALAKDWGYHAWLLERSVQSMLAQTRDDIRVIVGCHEIPELPGLRDSRIHFLPVGIRPPERNNDDMCVDKVLKLSAGVDCAIAQGCRYVIFNDADDLVSNRLGAFIAAHDGANGWYSGAEMFYTYGGRLVRRFVIPGKHSGPCVAVRSDLLTFDAPPFSGAWVDLVRRGGEAGYLELLARHGMRTNILAAVGIANYREQMEIEGHPLAPLPFPANVVINHRDSTATVSGGTGSYEQGGPDQRPAWRRAVSSAMSIVRKLDTLRVAGRSLRDEFSIPGDESIPNPYRTGSSIFWR